jgi:hypothetical protein
MPLLIIAPLVAMSHYEHVLNGRFGRLLAPKAGGGFLDVFRAADFSKRATAIVDRWEQRTAPADALTCPQGGVAMLVAEARRLIALPLPTECTDTSTTEAERAFAGSLPGANVTTFCDGVTDLLYAARSRFASVKTGTVDVDEDDGTQNWDSTVGPPNATCSIWQKKGDGTYARCTLFDAKSDDAGAEAAYKNAVQNVRACVTSAWTFTESADDTQTIKRAFRGEASSKGRELHVDWFRYSSSGRSLVSITIE